MMFGARGTLMGAPATDGAARLPRTPDIAASPAPICSTLRRAVRRARVAGLTVIGAAGLFARPGKSLAARSPGHGTILPVSCAAARRLDAEQQARAKRLYFGQVISSAARPAA